MARLDLTTESAVYVDVSRSLNASASILSVTDGDDLNPDFAPGENVKLNFGDNREQNGKVAQYPARTRHADFRRQGFETRRAERAEISRTCFLNLANPSRCGGRIPSPAEPHRS